MILLMEELEKRLVPTSSILAIGSGMGETPRIEIFDSATGSQEDGFLVFSEAFKGGVRVALADFNRDGVIDYLVGAGAGGGPHLKIFNGVDKSVLGETFVFAMGFTGGIQVATGNLDSDPFPEIIVGAGAGGGPHVKCFKFQGGSFVPLNGVLGSFFAYDPSFLGGVYVSAGNLNGFSTDEVITAAGSGGGPHVRVWNSNGMNTLEFFAYEEAFRGGVNLACGDLNQDGYFEIITAPYADGGPNIRVFSGIDGAKTKDFFAYDSAFIGGVEIGLIDPNFNGVPGIATITNARNSEFLYWDYNQSTGFPVQLPSLDFKTASMIAGSVRQPAYFNGTFIDPTVQLLNIRNIELSEDVLLAPFAILDASSFSIDIGNQSNLQDNVVLITSQRGPVQIGDRVVLAHGATVYGPSSIGRPGGLPSFVGFNAVVDGATIEEDCYIGILAKVAPGITIRSGTKVKPGKYISSQSEADDPLLGKVEPVTSADRQFISDVLSVNVSLANGYHSLYYANGINAVKGISVNPETDFNPTSIAPSLNGDRQSFPDFRNRIIGDVSLDNGIGELNNLMGSYGSIRADEGTPFRFGELGTIGDHFTAHALESTSIQIGENNSFGNHSLIHGGPDTTNNTQSTILGNNISVGDWSVVFRSTVSDNVTIGNKVLIDNSFLPANSVVPNGTIMINNIFLGFIEW